MSKNLIFGGVGNDLLLGDLFVGNRILGKQGQDSLIGGRKSDYLIGGSGDDILSGGVGRDTLEGQSGDNTLTGGFGDDTFILGMANRAPASVDVITDFDYQNVAPSGVFSDTLILRSVRGRDLEYQNRLDDDDEAYVAVLVDDRLVSTVYGATAQEVAERSEFLGGQPGSVTVLPDPDSEGRTNVTNGGNGFSTQPVISGDGTVVVFQSAASNLVEGETNPGGIVLFDAVEERSTYVTGDANSSSWGAEVSADGSTVAFYSSASNLVDGQSDLNGQVADVFVHDVESGTTTNVTDGGNAPSNEPIFEEEAPSLTADGTTVAFWSHASNLVDGQTDINGSTPDVFVHDVVNGETVNITDGGSDFSWGPEISADGSTVVFWSGATNLIPGQPDQNGSTEDIFIYDMVSGEFTNITNGADAWSYAPTISADGSAVAYVSFASNLVPSETDLNGNERDIFVYNVATGVTRNITNGADGPNWSPDFSGDGSTVVFSSNATNLVDGQADPDTLEDIMLYDVSSGEITNVTEGANFHSFLPTVSDNGDEVAFASSATNHIDGENDENGSTWDVFLFDLA
ncbi:MAG: hypothetical protein AAGG56_11710 [Pseudomonadota bacterium]